eukprot:gnl/TRDRNA2_/TRDRNA2_136837_c0_seq2.p1 gnl/TRDRNA2_/TRDRNA2_136837_c0~~gnl/TRDRNA2_/TRDRNA2_136837_c0_seq2.p1  ORF type:complete len:294 (-),score=27.36 gnl/TRDRNA2_/TRDRNA2_136837_c0_seq2:102-983(-)
MAMEGPKKLFVGSLPDGVTVDEVRTMFSKYGKIEDIFLKANCPWGRQWAFVTYSTHEEAYNAKINVDRQAYMPGCLRPIEAMFPRNHEPIEDERPTKLFVQNLPHDITELAIRQALQKYGVISSVFVNNRPVEDSTGGKWAFVEFWSHEHARCAKDASHQQLTFPGGAGPCEVTFAKNQGYDGQQLGSQGYWPSQQGCPSQSSSRSQDTRTWEEFQAQLKEARQKKSQQAHKVDEHPYMLFALEPRYYGMDDLVWAALALAFVISAFIGFRKLIRLRSVRMPAQEIQGPLLHM